jgi:RNA polymerase sigma-70 factor (ECF subfamily)
MGPMAPRRESTTERDVAADRLRAAAPRLRALATLILGNSHDAEDAMQDAMVAAWRKWDQLRDSDRRDAWLTKICVRQSLRHTRRLRLLRSREVGIRDDAAAAAPVDIEGDALDWDDAFDDLSKRQRAVVLLHYRYGYTLDECAELMGCRPGSARQHLARALRRLRENFNDGA